MQMHSRRMASHNVEIIWPEGTQPPITMTNPTPSPHEVFSRAPRKVPTLFGFYIYMDYLDRRIWEFCKFADGITDYIVSASKLRIL